MTRAEDIMIKLANMQKVKKFMSMGMSKEQAMAKAYPNMNKSANAKKVQENLKKGMSPQEAWNRAYPDGTNPKDKGVTDPARPQEPKLAGWGSAALDAAKMIPGIGAGVQTAQVGAGLAQGKLPSALEVAGTIPGVGAAARLGSMALDKIKGKGGKGAKAAKAGALAASAKLKKESVYRPGKHNSRPMPAVIKTNKDGQKTDYRGNVLEGKMMPLKKKGSWSNLEKEAK